MHVLLIEADPAIAERCSAALASNDDPWEVSHVRELSEGLGLRQSVDVVLTDLVLPDARGRAVLEMVAAGDGQRPVIALTDTLDLETGTSVLALGADDYVLHSEIATVDLRGVITRAIARREEGPAPRAAEAALDLYRDGDVIESLPFSARGLTIGRAYDNHLVIEHPNISRHHAQIWVEPDGVWLEDLHSTNGTTHDGRPVTGSTRVEGEVCFGTTVEARVRLLEASARTPIDASSMSVSVQFQEYPGASEGAGATLGVGPVTARAREPARRPRRDVEGQLPYRVEVLPDPPLPRVRIFGPAATGRCTITDPELTAFIASLVRRIDDGWADAAHIAVELWDGPSAASGIAVLVGRLRELVGQGGLDPTLVQIRGDKLRLAVQFPSTS